MSSQLGTKFTCLVHVKKDLDALPITDVNTFDAHVDLKDRAIVFVSSLVEISMALLQKQNVKQ